MGGRLMKSTGQELFRIELLAARHGDCILISYGPANAPYRVLIDGGPLSIYPALSARLYQIPEAERRLELLVISHIDSDHIGGIVKLLGDKGLDLRYQELWFNGWNQITQPLHPWSSPPLTPPSARTTRSPLEGDFVGLLVKRSGAPWNASFRGQAICIDRAADPAEVKLDGGLKLTLLSPDVTALKDLRSSWSKARERQTFDANNPEALQAKLDAAKRYRTRGTAQPVLSTSVVEELTGVAEQLDDAVANGSSIAFIAEYQGKRCAFLGDAHMPVVEATLGRLAKRYNEVRVRIDAVKVSHHGSKGNTTDRFLKLIDCHRYLISTDGSQFGHPDDEAIARIVQGGSKPIELHFNYLNDRTRRWADDDLQRSLGYRAFFPTAGDGVTLDLL